VKAVHSQPASKGPCAPIAIAGERQLGLAGGADQDAVASRPFIEG
jgi:hypothetical protein